MILQSAQAYYQIPNRHAVTSMVRRRLSLLKIKNLLRQNRSKRPPAQAMQMPVMQRPVAVNVNPSARLLKTNCKAGYPVSESTRTSETSMDLRAATTVSVDP